ncbi:SHOCT domain-containing protein [Microbacterium murale]|uniref:SHOCT domain-containing protein n=1 Tax=Microbacterium murale TaxID=1081040 RepID=A0ABQ1RX77_9MICO|nr:SHOCT domain-containing protein [Microbacterium murale]GGD81759.1 hypothetical protein GCM10007269_25670 [Microbacterium murale]
MPALTLNRAGRPGLIWLAERTRTISASSSDPPGNSGQLLYEAVRAVARAEAAVSRFSSARVPNVPTELERLAILHSSGELSDSEFAAAKMRVIGKGNTA